MSDEMAIGDNASNEEAKVNGDETPAASAETAEAVVAEPQIDPEVLPAEDMPAPTEEVPEVKQENIEDVPVKQEPEPSDVTVDAGDNLNKEIKIEEDEKRGVKRRASIAFSDAGTEDFKGFETVTQSEWDSMYSQVYHRIVDRLEAEVTAAVKDHTPLRTVMATPLAPVRPSKRLRQDTDGSRPSSALSSRSDGDGVISTDAASAASSPLQRGRRPTPEMSSPLLRVPLERGWKRELVYRATPVDARRNADIYYYTPQGKKLRSTREISEHLSGTGLTLDNFSFFKEPLGLDDPEKEIIRDARMQRRVESPVAAAAPVEGKRTPKPKPPKGATPEPPAVKSPPAKIKVKSVGSRLSTSGQTASPATPATNKQKKNATPASTTDNNNSAAWKKPRPPAAQLPQSPQPQTAAPQPQTAAPQPQTAAPQPQTAAPQPQTTAPPPRPCTPPQPPPPLQSRPPPSPDVQSGRRLVQPCSLSCGRGLPTLACAACLCLYHPACLGQAAAAASTSAPHTILCKNCRKSSSPPLEPPPLTHKSGVTASSVTSSISAPTTRRVPVPVPVPVAKGTRPEKRVLLRMKVAGGGPDGERVWAVAKPQPLPQLPQPQLHQLSQPQQQSHQLPQQQSHQLPQQQSHQLPQQKLHQMSQPQQQLHQMSQPQQQLHQMSQPQQQLHQMSQPQQQFHQLSQQQQQGRPPPAASPRALALRASLPQSLAVLNGRRFIVVPRSIVQPQHEDKKRGRLANGAASPPTASPAPAVASPRRRGRPRLDDTDYFTAFYNKAQEKNYNVVVQIFQYLGMRDLAHCARVCRLWKQLASTPALWRHVRMKNSHVSDWGGLCDALKRHGTKRLDLRKMLLPQNDTVFWEQFAQHISKVDTLERIEMCRCPARAVEAVMAGVAGLRALAALAIRDARLDPAPLAALPRLQELRLKSMAGLSLARDLRPLAALRALQHLSLTSIKDLGWCLCDVIGQLPQLETLELGECTFRAEFASTLRGLSRLRRLRLERGTAHCAAPAILRALAHLPLLTRLELVNIDVKVGFDDALAECKNIQRLLIIPTYVSQSATTNKQVLSGVLRLKDTLTHLMWGVTIELLRVTELFIDQCEQGGDAKKRDVGECIPVLKPVPGCKLPDEHHHVAGPPQVEILPLPTLQRLLSAQLPNTKLKLLRIPFHATWRQSLADFQ